MTKIVCGVDLAGWDANIALIRSSVSGQHEVVEQEVRKITLFKSSDSNSVKRFAGLWGAFLKDHGVAEVAIKQRASRGRYAGGSSTFKMEAIIQLVSPEVYILSNVKIARTIKSEGLKPPDCLFQYQHDAFFTAMCSVIHGN